MELESSKFLQDIISTGPDAQNNLFTVDFTFTATGNNSSTSDFSLQHLTCRLDQFIIPKTEAKTVPVPYQNTSIQKIVPSADVPKTFSIVFRMDQEYKLYRFLKDFLYVNENGVYDRDKDKYFSSVTVRALKQKDQDSLNKSEKKYVYTNTHTWTFEDCFVTSIDPITYSYTSTSAVTCKANFVFVNYR